MVGYTDIKEERSQQMWLQSQENKLINVIIFLFYQQKKPVMMTGLIILFTLNQEIRSSSSPLRIRKFLRL